MKDAVRVVSLGKILEPHAGVTAEHVGAGQRWSNHTSHDLRVRVAIPQEARKWTGALRLVITGAIERGVSAGVGFECGTEQSAVAPLNSQTLALSAGKAPTVWLDLGPRTTIVVSRFELRLEPAEADLFTEFFAASPSPNLLVSPLYPSSLSLYAASFTHSRVRSYLREGVKMPVVVVSYLYRYTTQYEFEGCTVFRTNYQGLTKLLSDVAFKNLLVHFFDEFIATALDRALKLDDTRLLFFCHGAETLFEDLVTEAGPYFCAPRKADANDLLRFSRRRKMLRKYGEDPRVTWVFMSQWQKRRSEELLGFSFDRSAIIHNFVDPAIFPRRPRRAEDRKRILFARRYDNERNYAIDVAVQVVLELSRRPFFKDLEFLFLGDGNYYDALVQPLRQFPNVKLERRFASHQELAELHGRCGIYLSPTRYDNQGVASCEAASSGTVVVSNAAGAGAEFRPPELGTISPTIDPVALADLIERLYREPDWFLSRSKAFSEFTQQQLSYANTISKELLLLAEGPPPVRAPQRVDAKTLSIVIPTYNMASMLPRCVHSIARARGAERLDVMIVDDGSKDDSLAVARQLAARYPEVVRVISKKNGGHGSAVNAGLAAATGRYFRVVDSDDYVDWIALGSLLDRLELESADVVLTDYVEDWPSYDWLDSMDLYGHLPPYQRLHLDHMVDWNYGFRRWGPLLSTSTYRTEVLRRAGVSLDEHCAYVDMEYNVLALHEVDSLTYYPLPIYVYSQGRATQTVHRESFIRKHRDHERVILRVADYIDASLKRFPVRRTYALNHVLKPLVVLQYEILGSWIGDKTALKHFAQKLKKYSFAADVALPASPPRQPVKMAEIVKNALPHAFVDGIEPAQFGVSSTTKLLKRVGRYLMPHIVVKTIKQKQRA